MATTRDAQEATVDSPPAHEQHVRHNGILYTTVKEGLAHILVPHGSKTVTDPQASKKETEESNQQVFYNPIQQFNRDLSVLAIRAFAEDYASRRSQRAEQKSAQLKKKKLRKRKQQDEAVDTTATDKTGGNSASNASKSEADSSVDPHQDQNHPKHALDADEKGEPTAVTGQAIASDEAAEASLARSEKRKACDDDVRGDAKKQRLGTELPHSHLHKSNNGHDAENGTDAAADPGPDFAKDPLKAVNAGDGKRPNDKVRKTMRILDALSATGLRALRYASELPLPTFVVANDLLNAATEATNLNIRHNKLADKIHAVTSNAQAHMYNAAFAHSGHTYGKYDVIDLDPYGTAVPFIEAALLALNDDGLLCVTCTDAGVFNSMGYLEKTYAMYGGIPIKGLHAHEGGLRLILNAIATTAAKHGLSIEPLLSLSIDFYARVFVRVRHSPADVKFLAAKTMIVHSCDVGGCGAWSTQQVARFSGLTNRGGDEIYKHHPALATTDKLCEHCGSKLHVAGPMWAGPLHNPWFIGRTLRLLPEVSKTTYATTSRIEGMLTCALDELEVISAFDELAAGKAGPETNRNAEAREANAARSAQSHVNGNVQQSPNPGQDPSTDVEGKGVQQDGHLIPRAPASIIDTHPFYLNGAHLAKVLKCIAPSEANIKGALRHMGYIATRTHAKPGMIKTQAPWSVIWEVMREFVRQKAPVKAGSLKEGSPGHHILYGEKANHNGERIGAEDPAVVHGEDIVMAEPGQRAQAEAAGTKMSKVVFDEVLGKDSSTRRLVRYQVNPRANWGPMSRAKG